MKSQKIIALLLATALLFNFSACQPRNELEQSGDILPQEQPKQPQESPAAPESTPPAEESTEPAFPTSYDSVEEMQAAFDQFILNEFVSQLEGDYLSIHQTLRHPEVYGIDLSEAEVTLGDAVSEEYLAEARAENLKLKEQFEAFDYALLTPEQQETYGVYEYLLNNALDSMKEEFVYMGGAFTPMQGLQNDISSLLMEFSFYEEADVKAYLEMMRDVPRYVEDTLAYTRKQAELGYFMPDVSAQSTLSYCKKLLKSGMDSALLSSVLYNIESCDFLSSAQVQSYQTEARQIFADCILPAYQNIHDCISSLMDPMNNQMGLAWFENGAEYYEYLFRLKTGSSRSVNATKLLLEHYMNSAMEEISAIAARNKPSYRAYLYQGLHTGYEGGGSILNDLETWVWDNFPYIEPVDYTVDYLDPQVAVDGVTAYYVVPPLDSDTTQKIKINPSGITNADDPSTFSTMAHEGLPGHLYQTNYVLQNLDDPFRQSVSILGYSEGYATYVEILSLNYLNNIEQDEENEYAFDADEVALAQYYTLFENCLIALCDIGIHYDRWTEGDMLLFMQQYLDIDDVSGIYNQLVGDPAGFLSYYVGCVEMLELRRMAQEELGDRFHEIDFHETILKGGDLPFSVLKKNVETYIEENKA